MKKPLCTFLWVPALWVDVSNSIRQIWSSGTAGSQDRYTFNLIVKNCHVVLLSGCTILHFPPLMYESFHCSSPGQNLVLRRSLIFVILLNVKWYLITVLISHSVISNAVARWTDFHVLSGHFHTFYEVYIEIFYPSFYWVVHNNFIIDSWVCFQWLIFLLILGHIFLFPCMLGFCFCFWMPDVSVINLLPLWSWNWVS